MTNRTRIWLNSSMQWVNKEFGKLLARARGQANLSQTELADRMQLSRASIINIEKGRQNITLVALYKLATILDASPDSLLPEQPDSLITKTDEIPTELQDLIRDELMGGNNG